MKDPAAPSGGSSPEGGLLLLAATPQELAPIQAVLRAGNGAEQGATVHDLLLCGVGPTAAAATVAGHLACHAGEYRGVILAGAAGAYPAPPEGPAGLLDICLAVREVLGDFGIAASHGADPFPQPEVSGEYDFPLDSPLLAQARAGLERLGVPHRCGTFVTVNAASATLERGLALGRRHGALCENMEGAAVALACRRHGVPLLEIRCVSNMVEDRDPGRWRLGEAVRRNADVLSRLLPLLAAQTPVGAQGR